MSHGRRGTESDSAAWVELQIEVGAAAADLVAADASEFAGGIELRDADTLLRAAPDRVVVVAMCAPEAVDELLASVEETCARARAAGVNIDPVAIRRRDAREEEWRDIWKQFFRATRVGRRFLVRPSWDLGDTVADDLVIDIDPGRAFGTGGHPSTRMVIDLAEGLADAGTRVQRFLDLGCGSGILAIAAARLWPKAAGLAVDVDPEAADCTGENLQRNRVLTVDVHTGGIESAVGEFDLVLANIQADVLLELAPALRARLAPGGHLILSGLLVSDAAAVQARYSEQLLTLCGRQEDGEWAALAFAARQV